MVSLLTALTIISFTVAVSSWLLASNATSPVKTHRVGVQDTWLATVTVSAARVGVSVSIPFLAGLAIFIKYVEGRSGRKQADRIIVNIAVLPCQVTFLVMSYIIGHMSAGCNSAILYVIERTQIKSVDNGFDGRRPREQQFPGGWPSYIELLHGGCQEKPRMRRTNRYGLIDSDTSDSEESAVSLFIQCHVEQS